MTKGEIGVLVAAGEQIGGFLDWTISTSLGSNPKKPESVTVAEAKGFWLFDRPSGKVTAKFYQRVGDRLVLIQEVAVTAEFPYCEFDRLIKVPLEMVFA